MTLTRHFYDLQEVHVAYEFCLINHRTQEACFWLLELIDSGEPFGAINILIEVYLVRYGTAHLWWLIEAYKMIISNNIDTEILFILTVSLCKIQEPDTSFLSLHFTSLQDMKNTKPPDGLPKSVFPVESASLTPPEKFFARSLFERKIRNCLWILSKCSPVFVNETINFLKSSLPSTIVLMVNAMKTLNDWTWLHYNDFSIITLTLMMICLRPEDYSKSLTMPPSITMSLSSHIYKNIIEWEQLTGFRARRIYEIPRDSLYMKTDRGMMSYLQDTFGNLRTLGSSIDNTYMGIYNCTFWKELWAKCNPSGTTDEGYDAFCEFAFPNDIPDEWSLEDQKKSHGQGVTNPGERFYWRRWLRSYMNTHSMESSGAEKKYHINNSHYIVSQEIEQFDPVLPKSYMTIQYLLQHLSEIIYNGQIKLFSRLDDSFLGKLENKQDIKNEIILGNAMNKLSLL